MSYLDQASDPRRRAVAVVTVGAVHALLAVGLVGGLAVRYALEDRRPLAAINVPVPPLPSPEPTPTPSPSAQAVIVNIPPAPVPPIDLTQASPIERVDVADPLPVAVRLPEPSPGDADPKPRPSPSFTPTRPAPLNQGRWIDDSDYPRRALVEAAEGTVGYRVVVGTNGRVSSCELTRPVGHRALDDATCRLLTSRARFEPATDESGAKAVGTYSGSVTWRLPD